MKKDIKILAVETSCDETAAAVVCGANESYKIQDTNNKQISNFKFEIPKVLSNVVSSSAGLHAKTGGIVPEIASRAQMEAMIPVVNEALKKASTKIDDITHVAVTNGPGLIGSLLVGFNAAKTVAYAKNLPFIPINHIEGHIYSALAPNQVESRKSKVESDGVEFPILALTVSGGHTSLTIMQDHGVYETIGETLDDAAGEAFDKVAKLLELGYPGGPAVSELAGKFRNRSMKNEVRSKGEPKSHASYSQLLTPIKFPRPLIDKPNFDFSFSGLKTAVLTQTIKHPIKTKEQKQEICFAFEEAAVEVLCTKSIRAAKKYKPKVVILAGGVAANSRLREELRFKLKDLNLKLEMPPIELCGDNAAMIGLAAYYHVKKNNIPELFSTTVDSNLAL